MTTYEYVQVEAFAGNEPTGDGGWRVADFTVTGTAGQSPLALGEVFRQTTDILNAMGKHGYRNLRFGAPLGEGRRRLRLSLHRHFRARDLRPLV